MANIFQGLLDNLATSKPGEPEYNLTPPGGLNPSVVDMELSEFARRKGMGAPLDHLLAGFVNRGWKVDGPISADNLISNRPPDKGGPEPTLQAPIGTNIFAPLLEEKEKEVVTPDIDPFGMAVGPGMMKPGDTLAGAGAAGVDFSKMVLQGAAGGLGEVANLPGNIQQDPSRIGETFRGALEAFPIEWEKWGILTPEGEHLRRSMMEGPFQALGEGAELAGEKTFNLPQVDPLTGETIADTSPILAAIVKSGIEMLPVLGGAKEAMKSVGKGGVRATRAAKRGIAEILPEDVLVKYKGKSFTRQNVIDAMAGAEGVTPDPALMAYLKDLALTKEGVVEIRRMANESGVDMKVAEKTWLGKFLTGDEPIVGKPEPGKKPPPPEEPPAPAPSKPEPTPEKPPPGPGAADANKVWKSKSAAERKADIYRDAGVELDVVDVEGGFKLQTPGTALGEGAPPSPQEPGPSPPAAEPPRVERKPRPSKSPLPEAEVGPEAIDESLEAGELDVEHRTMELKEEQEASKTMVPGPRLRAASSSLERAQASLDALRARKAELDKAPPTKQAKYKDKLTGLRKEALEIEAEKAGKEIGEKIRYAGEEVNVDPPWQMFEVTVPEVLNSAGEPSTPSFYVKPGESLTERAKAKKAEFIEKNAKPAPRARVKHFTRPENIDKILEKGFDTSLPPVHGTGSFERREAFDPKDKVGKDVLYFTTDEGRWSKATVYVGEGKGTKDYNFYDYENQKWVSESKAQATIDLSAIEADIKEGAKTLTIDSIEALSAFQKKAGMPTYTKLVLTDIVEKAQEMGYEILNVKRGKGWFKEGKTDKYGEKDLYNQATGASGNNDYFILNKEAIDLVRPEKEPVVDKVTAAREKLAKKAEETKTQVEKAALKAKRPPEGMPRHVADLLIEEGFDPSEVKVVKSKAEEKEIAREYGIPNNLLTPEGHPRFGKSDKLYIDDDSGKPVAYAPEEYGPPIPDQIRKPGEERYLPNNKALNEEWENLSNVHEDLEAYLDDLKDGHIPAASEYPKVADLKKAGFNTTKSLKELKSDIERRSRELMKMLGIEQDSPYGTDLDVIQNEYDKLGEKHDVPSRVELRETRKIPAPKHADAEYALFKQIKNREVRRRATHLWHLESFLSYPKGSKEALPFIETMIDEARRGYNPGIGTPEENVRTLELIKKRFPGQKKEAVKFGKEDMAEPPIPKQIRKEKKAKKAEGTETTVSGYLKKTGRIRISSEEWENHGVWENGLAPRFTTKAKGRKGESLKWDKAVQEMVELNILPADANLDTLVERILAEKEALAKGEPITPEGVDEKIARKGEEHLARKSEELAKYNQEEVKAYELLAGDRFSIEGEEYTVVSINETEGPEKGFLTVKDGETVTLHPDTPLQIDNGIEGVTKKRHRPQAAAPKPKRERPDKFKPGDIKVEAKIGLKGTPEQWYLYGKNILINKYDTKEAAEKDAQDLRDQKGWLDSIRELDEYQEMQERILDKRQVISRDDIRKLNPGMKKPAIDGIVESLMDYDVNIEEKDGWIGLEWVLDDFLEDFEEASKAAGKMPEGFELEIPGVAKQITKGKKPTMDELLSKKKAIDSPQLTMDTEEKTLTLRGETAEVGEFVPPQITKEGAVLPGMEKAGKKYKIGQEIEFLDGWRGKETWHQGKFLGVDKEGDLQVRPNDRIMFEKVVTRPVSAVRPTKLPSPSIEQVDSIAKKLLVDKHAEKVLAKTLPALQEDFGDSVYDDDDILEMIHEKADLPAEDEDNVLIARKVLDSLKTRKYIVPIREGNYRWNTAKETPRQQQVRDKIAGIKDREKFKIKTGDGDIRIRPTTDTHPDYKGWFDIILGDPNAKTPMLLDMAETYEKAVDFAKREARKIKDFHEGKGKGDSTFYGGFPLFDPKLWKNAFPNGLPDVIKDFQRRRQLAKDSLRPDLNWFNDIINTPRHVFVVRHPEGKPVFERARKGFQEREDITGELSEILTPYVDLSFEQQKLVNRILARGRHNRKVYDLAELQHEGLDDAQIEGYRSVRKSMERALDLFEDGIVYRITNGRIPSSHGIPLEMLIDTLDHIYGSDQSSGGLFGEGGDLSNAKVDFIVKAVKKIRESKRKGYVPFSRFGDFAYGVKYLEGPNKGTYREWSTAESKKAAAKAFMDLEKKYARGIAAGKLEAVPPEEMLKKGKSDLIQNVGPFEVGILLEMAGLDTGSNAAFKELVDKLVQEQGFKKHFFESKDTPGYTMDFERALADYIIGLSGYIARMKMIPEMDLLAVQAFHRKPALAKYYNEWKKYIVSPHEEFHRVRSALFIYYLGLNPKSALVNFTQTAVMTLPWMIQYVSEPKAAKAVVRAMREVTSAIGKLEDGTTGVDIEKLPADVREHVRRGIREGVISDQLVYELMGKAKHPPTIRKISKHKQRSSFYMGYLFSRVEKMNRLVAMIAAIRVHEAMKAKRAALGGLPGQKRLGGGGTEAHFEDDPFEFGKRAVDETQFIYSKLNRPRMFRKTGALLGVFRTFSVMFMETLSKIWGVSRRAAIASLGMLTAFAGVLGLPFASDIKGLLEGMYGFLSHRQPDVETDMKEWANDVFGTTMPADLFLHGAVREVTGMDLSRSVGQGDIVPGLGSKGDLVSEIIGVPADIVKRAKNSFNRFMEGSTFRAIEGSAPEFIRNPMVAARWAKEGVLTPSGNIVVNKDRVSTWDIALKALGVQPTKVSKAYEREDARNRLKNKLKKVEADLTRNIVNAYRKGNVAEAERLLLSADGWVLAKRSRNGDPMIRLLPSAANKAPEDLVLLNEITLSKTVLENNLGEAFTGMQRMPSVTRPAFLKLNELYK